MRFPVNLSGVVHITPAPGNGAVHVSRSILSDTPLFYSLLLSYLNLFLPVKNGTSSGSFQFGPRLNKYMLKDSYVIFLMLSLC